MSGTTSFSAGSLTLSGFVTDFMNQDTATGMPGGAMLQPQGTVFDYNWTANTTNIVTASSDSPQIITGSGSGSADLVLSLSSTFSIFHPPGRQVITQKISSWAMKRSALSIDRTVRPNGPVEAHRSFQSDQ